MELIFESFSLLKEDGTDYFMVACKDREVVDSERYVVVTLSDEEMKKVFDKLKMYFN